MGLEVVLPSGNKYKIGLDEALRIGRVPTNNPEVLKEKFKFKVKNLPQTTVPSNLMVCIETEYIKGIAGIIKECYIEEELEDSAVSIIDPDIGKYGSISIFGGINKKIGIRVSSTTTNAVKVYTASLGEKILNPKDWYESDESMALKVGSTLIYVYYEKKNSPNRWAPLSYFKKLLKY